MIDEILLEIQHNFPICAKPFEAIANKFETTEQNVIEILRSQKMTKS